MNKIPAQIAAKILRPWQKAPKPLKSFKSFVFTKSQAVLAPLAQQFYQADGSKPVVITGAGLVPQPRPRGLSKAIAPAAAAGADVTAVPRPASSRYSSSSSSGYGYAS